jgi:predicted HicB family RNase H-like nuclease
MMVAVQNKSMGDFRVRGIPEDVHRKLKALAALAGVSVNDYMLAVLKEHIAKQKGKL